MRRMLGLAVAVVVGLGATCLGGAMYRNDLGAVARAVRIEFSEPAEITSMWPSFPQRDPQGPAMVIVLSGGEIAAGGWFSFTWRPDAARVVTIEWFASPPSSARPNLGFSDPKPKPEVHGELLNPAFFAHPAYVMQGVSERDEVFALPLHGVPELPFHPVLGDLPASSLAWTFELSHPEGIGAAIEDGTLFIWGSNPEWQGYGEVTLYVSAPDGRSGHVAIPVVVFCTDRTLVNPQGKKDYFVPWRAILDINRILSVEEHMRQYNKPDVGLLDRTLLWSRWRKMEPLFAAVVSTFWPANLDHPAEWWQRSTQYALVDVWLSEFKEIGYRSVIIHNAYYTEGITGTEVRAVYDHFTAGAAKTERDIAYIVNEAHRLGMGAVVTPWVAVDSRTTDKYTEMWEATPTPASAFWASYTSLVLDLMAQWQDLGVDIAGIGMDIELLGPLTWDNTGLTDRALRTIADESRAHYSGPLASFTSFQFGPRRIVEAGFLQKVDIVSPEIYDPEIWPKEPLSRKPDPSVEDLMEGWRRRISMFFQPFQQTLNKPFVPHSTGCFPWPGGEVWGESGAVRLGGSLPLDLVDLAAQDRCFESQFRAFESMEGYFGPVVCRYDFTPWTLGGPGDRTFTPRNKPVEDFFRTYMGGSARQIHIDGRATDWGSALLLIMDPQGDSRPAGADITAVWAALDDAYLYVAVQYAADPPRPGLTVWIDINSDRKADYYIGGGPFRDPDRGTWFAMLHRTDVERRFCGVADIAWNGPFVELRIARRYLGDLHDVPHMTVTHHGSVAGIDDEIAGWHLFVPLQQRE